MKLFKSVTKKKIIKQYRKTFDKFFLYPASLDLTERFDLTVVVRPDDIEYGDTERVIGLWVALQPYPEVIGRFLGSLRFKFKVFNDIDDVLYEPDRWSSNIGCRQWIFNLATEFPAVMFFLRDPAMQWASLANDLLETDTLSLSVTSLLKMKETNDKISTRMFYRYYYFLLYCHESGFDAETYLRSYNEKADFPIDCDKVIDKYRVTVERYKAF